MIESQFSDFSKSPEVPEDLLIVRIFLRIKLANLGCGSIVGTPQHPPTPLKSIKCYGECYPELCAKCNFYLCPFEIRIWEKRTVVHLPILRAQFEQWDSL